MTIESAWKTGKPKKYGWYLATMVMNNQTTRVDKCLFAMGEWCSMHKVIAYTDIPKPYKLSRLEKSVFNTMRDIEKIQEGGEQAMAATKKKPAAKTAKPTKVGAKAKKPAAKPAKKK